MATRKLCSAVDCDNPSVLRHLCRKHYQRLRTHGDPNYKGKTSRNEISSWLNRHVLYASDECLIFPFWIDNQGYGRASYDGAEMSASRVMCILAHGLPPDPTLEAAHGCHTPACVNPAHLRWATHLENVHDMHENGTFPRGENMPQTKLTEKQVREIRSSVLRNIDLSRMYGVTASTICNIKKRRAWGWLE